MSENEERREKGEYGPAEIARLTQVLKDFVPHNRALGITVERVGIVEVWSRLPWAPKLVGNPVTGVLHGGAIASLMDATCGLSIMARLGHPSNIATLDLRIDYLKPGTPRRDVFAWASCYKVTRHVCFVRGGACHRTEDGRDEIEDPIAAVAGTFARKRSGA